MYTNADCTIYNKYLNPVTKLDEYKRTYLKGVFWDASKGANIKVSGLETADAVKILIPFAVNAEGKTFRRPKEWQKTPNVDMSKYFTFQPGDKICKGIIDYEIPPGTIAYLEKNYDEVYNITTVDIKESGSPMMQHFEVGGR